MKKLKILLALIAVLGLFLVVSLYFFKINTEKISPKADIDDQYVYSLWGRHDTEDEWDGSICKYPKDFAAGGGLCKNDREKGFKMSRNDSDGIASDGTYVYTTDGSTLRKINAGTLTLVKEVAAAGGDAIAVDNQYVYSLWGRHDTEDECD